MIPIRLYIIGGALLASFLAGGYTHYRWTEAEAIKTALQASEDARKTEHDSAATSIRRLDSYSVTASQNQIRAIAARSDADSVRHSLAAIASAAPASACGAENDRLRAISQLLGEGVGLVAEGAEHVETLRARAKALEPSEAP